MLPVPITDAEAASDGVRRVTGSGGAGADCGDLTRRRKLDIPFAEPDRVRARGTYALPAPDVEAEMMVIAAR
jgi:hypothetical protein